MPKTQQEYLKDYEEQIVQALAIERLFGNNGIFINAQGKAAVANAFEMEYLESGYPNAGAYSVKLYNI